jgi:hypothetical protein
MGTRIAALPACALSRALLRGVRLAINQRCGDDSLKRDVVIERAKRPDGFIRPFEILVRSTSINWNSTDSQVIASRVH